MQNKLWEEIERRDISDLKTKDLIEPHWEVSDIISREEEQLAFFDEEYITLINELREDKENIQKIFENKEFMEKFVRFQSSRKDQN